MSNKILSAISYIFFIIGTGLIFACFATSLAGFLGADLTWSWEALMAQLWIAVGVLLLSWFFGSVRFP